MAASAQSFRGPSVPGQSRVGGYRIIRKLAVGGMAEIYLARLEAAHGFTKQVVIKRLLPHLCEDPSFVAMFLHEARLAAGLSHPNIAQVFDIGESDGRLHYAMEYVHGPDLRDVAKRIHARGQTPPLDLVIGVCIGVAAGLHYAHTARDEAGRELAIVHRDVTPSNVVVTYGGVAKLLDFGVAKAKLDDRESTAVGVLKGKLPYMSPEQIECTLALDGRSDVFSLGVMLWELTTLRRLYRGSPAETVRRITSEDAPPPSSVCDDYPLALETIVLRALARDRDQRYASAFELQRALELFALDHQLVTSGSRIAELMAELFADELEDERARLEAEPREVTDSEVFTAHWSSERVDGDDGDDGHDGHDAPTRASAVLPNPVPVLVPSLAEPRRDEAQPSSRRWPWIAGAAGSVLVVVLAWKAFGAFGSDGSSVPVEPSPTVTAPAAAQPSEVPVATSEAPVPTSTSTPSLRPAEPEPQPEPQLEPRLEPTPSKPSKRKRPAARSSSKTPAEWDKNSLALPE